MGVPQTGKSCASELRELPRTRLRGGRVAHLIEGHQEYGNESQHHAREIVTSGNLLVDEQREHDGHEREQTVDHRNNDDGFAVTHGVDEEQASQGVETLDHGCEIGSR